MKFSRVLAVSLRHYFLIKNNPSRLASIFLWLLVDVTLWGFISKYLGTFGNATFSFVTVILGAIILWEFVTRVQQGMMTGFLEDVWSQNFVNYFASPLRLSEYLAGTVLTSLSTGLIGFMMVIVVASLAFDYSIFVLGVMIIPYMAVLFLFGISMGIFVAGLIFRLGPTAEWLGWPIPLVLSLFAGVFYPVDTLPMALRAISRVIPASYVFEGIRAIISGRKTSAEILPGLLLGATLAVIYLIFAYYHFLRVYRRNLENGSIVQFSAESF